MTKPTYHPEIVQGTDEWLAIRCGRITASEVKKLLTSKFAAADNDTSRKFIAELTAQRITKHVEPRFITDDMLRGHIDEVFARNLYSEKYAPVTEVGFATAELYPGITIGASPDGLVGDTGLIEVKSRIQRAQIETIVAGTVPDEYMAQIQCQLLVTNREWCDFISYCGGLPMFVKRVHRDEAIIATIFNACAEAEHEIQRLVNVFELAAMGLHPTERQLPDTDVII